MDLLSLLQEGVVLSDSSEGELVHEVDLVGLVHPLVLEVLDDDGERRGEEHDLSLLGHEREELLDDGRELGREELVGLVHDERLALAQVCDSLAGEIEDPSRRTDEDVHSLAETHDIVSQRRSSGGDHDRHARVLAERLADLRGLERELTRGDEEKRLDLVHLGVDALEGGDDEGGRLARPVLGSCEHVATRQRDGDRLFLDGRRLLELVRRLRQYRRGNDAGSTHACLENTQEQFALEVVIRELVPLGSSDVLQPSRVRIPVLTTTKRDARDSPQSVVEYL